MSNISQDVEMELGDRLLYYALREYHAGTLPRFVRESHKSSMTILANHMRRCFFQTGDDFHAKFNEYFAQK